MYKSKFSLIHGATAFIRPWVSKHFLLLAVLFCMLIAVVYKQPGSFSNHSGIWGCRQIQSIRGGIYDVGEEVDDDLILLAQRQLDGRSETFPGNCKDFFQIVNAYTYSRSFQQWNRSKPRQLHYLIISISTAEKLITLILYEDGDLWWGNTRYNVGLCNFQGKELYQKLSAWIAGEGGTISP